MCGTPTWIRLPDTAAHRRAAPQRADRLDRPSYVESNFRRYTLYACSENHFEKVSEGGLGPRQWWYIPERGIHHHSKLTRQGPAGPAFRRRKEAAAPACPTGPGM